jgi:hypothetical protein
VFLLKARLLLRKAHKPVLAALSGLQRTKREGAVKTHYRTVVTGGGEGGAHALMTEAL